MQPLGRLRLRRDRRRESAASRPSAISRVGKVLDVEIAERIGLVLDVDPGEGGALRRTGRRGRRRSRGSRGTSRTSRRTGTSPGAAPARRAPLIGRPTGRGACRGSRARASAGRRVSRCASRCRSRRLESGASASSPCEVGKRANTSSPWLSAATTSETSASGLRMPLVGLGVDGPPFDAGDAPVGVEADLGDRMHFHVRSLAKDAARRVCSARPCGARCPASPARIHAAARSAIISVGALVLPLVIVGITLASTTRRPAMPWTRRRASTTAADRSPAPSSRCRPDGRWSCRCRRRAAPARHRTGIDAGLDLARPVLLERRLGDDAPRQAQALRGDARSASVAR